MFTDIEGYTSMMQENEQDAMAKRNRQREVLELYISSHEGKILQSFGDGTLCVFSSAIQAVKCAVKIQGELQLVPQVPLRIGIHIGDIAYDNNDIYGDSVNVASRIESLSVAGAVLISERVYDDIKNQPLLPAVSLGHFEFKNVSRAIEIFAISLEGITVPKPNELKGKLKNPVQVIAVLPFINMSNDPENEYFSDGITEEILNALTKVEGLQVIARTSSFSFKGKDEDIREIGRKLNATSLIEGSVRKAGNRVRITAQLIRVSDGVHYWSEVYDRELTDIFKIQDEISLNIAGKFEGKAEDSKTPESLVDEATANVDAYEFYLKALHCQKLNTEGNEMLQAIKYYQEAVRLDPGFAKAYAGISMCYSTLGVWGLIHPQESYPKAKESAEKALELDANICESHLAVSAYKMLFEWDWKGVRQSIQNALKLNPGQAEIYTADSHYYKAIGLYEKAISSAKRAVELDPLSEKRNNDLAFAYLDAGKYEESFQIFQKTLIINPASRPTDYGITLLYIDMGEYEKAIEKLESMGEWVNNISLVPISYAKTGRYEKAYEYIGKYKQIAESDKSRSMAFHLACIYSSINDFDNAFKYLEQAIDERIGGVIMLKSTVAFKNMHSDPRFAPLLKKIGLPV